MSADAIAIGIETGRGTETATATGGLAGETIEGGETGPGRERGPATTVEEVTA